MLDLRNCDCLDLMAEFPDKHFDLAIVDPPYGIGEDGRNNHTRGNLAKASDYRGRTKYDCYKPNKSYFEELIRVSQNQIIWGANHFGDMPASSEWIIWDKLNGDNDFADCELAFTSFNGAARKFTFMWNGMLQGDMKNKEVRQHPNQKPIKLYNWILHNYAKPGQRILDTHLGSGSIAIACHYFGCDLTGSEIDKDYYDAMIKRVKEQTSQLTLI